MHRCLHTHTHTRSFVGMTGKCQCQALQQRDAQKCLTVADVVLHAPYTGPLSCTLGRRVQQCTLRLCEICSAYGTCPGMLTVAACTRCRRIWGSDFCPYPSLAMLLFVEPARSVVNNGRIVPCRVCGQLRSHV